MIYLLEKRHEFGFGTMTTHWEVRSYTHKSAIGALVNGKTLKKGSLKECRNYCRRKNITIEDNEV